MAQQFTSFPSGLPVKSRPASQKSVRFASLVRPLLSLFAVSLVAACSLSGFAQASYVPPVVVTSLSPVPVPSLTANQLTGSLTNVVNPVEVALDACGNLYTLDYVNNSTSGVTLDEIPANGGAASVVANLGQYYPGHLGQDPTHTYLIAGQAYGTGGNSIPLANCVPQTAQTQHIGGGNGALFYYYNPGYFAGDFLGNTYISTQSTCCVTGQNYLVQEPKGDGNNGNILLSNQSAEIQSLAVDKNQNIYFISNGALFELQSAGGGSYATTPVAYGTAYANPVGVSVDTAGNLYIVDQGAGTIYEIPNETIVSGGTSLNPADQFVVSSSVNAAVAVAVDAQGDLYYTQQPQSIYNPPPAPVPVEKLSRGGADFGTVTIGQTATRTLNFQFNSPVIPGAILLSPGSFAIDNVAGSMSCALGVPYAPGGPYSTCTLNVTFSPTKSGTQSGAILLQNKSGLVEATAILEGTGASALQVGTTTTLTANPNSNLMAGVPITLTATVVPVSGSEPPTGTVTFADPAGGSITVPLAGGKAIYSGTVPPVGTYSVYANYNGTAGFAASRSTTITSTVAAAVPYLIPNGTYVIVSKHSGLDVEVPGSSTVSGTTLDQAPATGAANQIWQVVNLGSNYIEILNVNSNMAIEVPGASLVDGLSVDQAPFTSETSQIWQVVASGPYVVLLNENSGLALDVFGDSTSAGAVIDQYPGSGSDNQAWTFTRTAYTPPKISSVSITPGSSTVFIGQQQQFTAKVNGTGSVSNTVTWSIAAPASSTLSPGTISTSGLYITPYPAPATVTLTATSTQDVTKSAIVTLKLTSPAASTGPALSVDAGNQTHTISPDIYGINGNNNGAMPKLAQTAGTTVDRWGGDGATRYNYKNDQYNSASDYWFQNEGVGTQDNSQFNQQVVVDAANRMKTLGTVPLIGYTANGTSACSYSIAKYGAQEPSNGLAAEPYKPDCGFGVSVATGQNVVNDPTDTSFAIDDTWTTGWVQYLTSKFGTAANGGVAIYDLDNEPSDWSYVHKDVHPLPFTYDELTTKGLTYAAAIKAVDPTAEVSGPIMDGWYDYFYSAKDVNAGYGQGPCYAPWANPIDRKAHGGVAFFAYYLQQFAAYAAAHNGTRLLDYLDIHGYYAAHPNGNNVDFSPAGDTSVQAARVNSTRAFWDPTYTDSYYTIPNYPTDPNYVPQTGNTCNPPPLQPLQLIPFLQQLVANNYPGTKAAIDEYNFGAQESVNGAVTQADVLGIFGAQGLDLGAYWPGTNDPTQEGPILQAFAMYRNYDGKDSTFGNKALASTSGNQGALSVYGALRTADNSVTVVVINKSYGDLTTTLSLANMSPNGQAQVYLYSNANLAGIQQTGSITVTPPAKGSTSSSVKTTFPAQSITLLIIPKK